jgi:hypothetical protein
MVILLVMLIAAVGGSVLAMRRTVPSPVDVAWLAGPEFADTARADRGEALELCRRYLSRHARHRFIGGVVGVLFAVVVGVRWYGTVTLGIGSANPLADVLFCGLAGVIIGALSAETFRLGSDGADQRAASLTPRTIDAGRARLLLARGLAVVAVGVGVAAGVSGHGWVALMTGVVAAAPLAVAEWVRVAIVTRARPVMTDRARLLDDRLRSFAASSVSYLEVATAALMLGWTLSKIADLPAVLAASQIVAVVVCLVVAVVCLRRGAPRHPRHIANDLVLTGQPGDA